MSITSRYTSNERTKVFRQPERMISTTLRVYSRITSQMDAVCDEKGIEIVINTKPIWNGFNILYNKGVKLRCITNITKENLKWCKEFVKIVQVRHIDGIKGAFAIHDDTYYLATTNVLREDMIFPSEIILSNVKAIVQQQQYIFNLLWDKAIPAKHRFKEIENRQKREFIDTIRDPSDILESIFDIVKSASEYIRILFYDYAILQRLMDMGLIENLKNLQSGHKIEVDVLICIKCKKEIKKIEEELLIFKHEMYEKSISLRLRYISKNSFKSNVTTFIIDTETSLVIEMKDSIKNDTYEDSVNIAIYSNIQSTVHTNSIIFENLWNRSEIEMKEV